MSSQSNQKCFKNPPKYLTNYLRDRNRIPTIKLSVTAFTPQWCTLSDQALREALGYTGVFATKTRLVRT